MWQQKQRSPYNLQHFDHGRTWLLAKKQCDHTWQKLFISTSERWPNGDNNQHRRNWLMKFISFFSLQGTQSVRRDELSFTIQRESLGSRISSPRVVRRKERDGFQNHSSRVIATLVCPANYYRAMKFNQRRDHGRLLFPIKLFRTSFVRITGILDSTMTGVFR